MNNELFKSDFDNIKVPQCIDLTIENAIRKGKRKLKFRYIKPAVGLFASICAIFVMLIFTFPSFAQTLSEVPIISNLINAFQFDKGLTLATKNGLSQKVSLYAEDQGVKVSINGIIQDDKSTILAYTIQILKGHEDVEIPVINKLSIMNTSGNVLSSTDGNDSSMIRISGGDNKKGYSSGYINIPTDSLKTHDKQSNTHLLLHCTSIFSLASDPTKAASSSGYKPLEINGLWDIAIDISKAEKAKPKVYNVNRVIQSENIKLEIKSVEVHATTTLIELFVDNSESQYIRMYFEDANGNVFNQQDESFLPLKGIRKVNLESIYFSDFNDLSFVVEKIEPNAKSMDSSNIMQLFKVKLN